MKSQNINNSSRKTEALIKRVFAEMLSEKMELGRISVSELCKRCDISRGAFYSHYDDIYSVAEDYENELIDKFFDNEKLLNSNNFEKFLKVFFDYIKENDHNYRLLCKSNDFLFAAKKLTTIASNKFLEICTRSHIIKNKKNLKLEINIFIEGLMCEYVKYCRGYSTANVDDLYEYTKEWLTTFAKNRL